MVHKVDLGATFGNLRKKVIKENNIYSDVYFVFGSKKLVDGEFDSLYCWSHSIPIVCVDKELELYGLQEVSNSNFNIMS